jgi:hypothetical protein
MTEQIARIIGPVLILDDLSEGRLHLAALFIAPPEEVPEPIEAEGRDHAALCLARYAGAAVWRIRFSLPADRAGQYHWQGGRYDLAGDLSGDLRLAYVSCNGEEIGDLDRADAERNVMWARLRAQHEAAPFALLLHGGDQVYADEVTRGHPLSEDWPEDFGANPATEALADLRRHLREGFLARYARLYRAPQFAWLAARVPSLMQWDDHDICDGWGSLQRSSSESTVGETLFDEARAAFLLFQQACAPGDLPPRFADAAGRHLGWTVRAPGLRLIAPDLRGERSRRRVMGPGGWAAMEAEAARPAAGQSFVLSSVPLLGPRLSILEAVMVLIPSMQKYEDDLRDQWQSRSHREEWRRMLRLVREIGLREGQRVTALSGEIHLATRAEMRLGPEAVLHQLVASGVAHRAPPKAWARFLGTLARLGESPLRGHPIRIRPLPGRRALYVAERNTLLLERAQGRWTARWDLEESGLTPPLPL